MRNGQSSARSSRVALVVFPQVQALDVAGPLDVFAEANAYLPAEARYELTIVGATRAPVRASNGLQIVADVTFAEAHPTYDLVLVAGGPELPTAAPDAALIAWLVATTPRARRFGSICTGAFVLGRAGLLDGKTVTTHWQNAPLLQKLFPAARVELDRLHVEDGALVTSAGVTAGIDLALALLQADHGSAIAVKVAKRLVVVMQRQGGQSQFSPHLVPAAEEGSPIARVRSHVLAQLTGDASVGTLARVAGMSARSFSRTFKEQTGVTPAEFVESIRVDAARNRLESTAASLKAVAADCGFSGADHMRTVFVKRLGVTPTHYRDAFRISPPNA